MRMTTLVMACRSGAEVLFSESEHCSANLLSCRAMAGRFTATNRSYHEDWLGAGASFQLSFDEYESGWTDEVRLSLLTDRIATTQSASREAISRDQTIVVGATLFELHNRSVNSSHIL